MNALLQDLRFAVRGLRKAPLFAGIAVLSLALGIGANTAIFSLLDQLMLRLLPVRNPHQLALLTWRGAHIGNNTGSNSISYPMYLDLKARNEVFSDLAGRYGMAFSIGHQGQTERVDGELVTGNYFSLLGVEAELGRLITPEDDRTPDGHPVVVLGYDYWKQRFAGDRSVVGKPLAVNGRTYTIIGVSRQGFYGIEVGAGRALRIPIMQKGELSSGWMTGYSLDNRRGKWVNAIGRVKPGITIERAKAGLQPLFKSLLVEDLKTPELAKATTAARQRFLNAWLDVTPAAKGRSELRRSFEKPLWILMAMVGVVLLIACANIANLLLARAAGRQKEIAVRFAIGSSRPRIVRQLLTESLLLAFAGGLAGLLVAMWSSRLLVGLLPAGDSPVDLSTSPDFRVLGFALAISIATGIVFGLFPAIRASRVDLAPILKEQAGSLSSGGHSRIRRSLVVAQVFLSLLLLVGAGLFLRSLNNLRTLDPGFQVSKVIAFTVDPSQNGYQNERSRAFFRLLQEKIEAIPGVESAGFGVIRLLSADQWDRGIVVEGYEARQGENMSPFFNAVTPGYFKTLGIPVIAGREFTEADAMGRPKVAIVNEAFAGKFFGDRGALGRRVGFGSGPETVLDIEIAGVTRDAKYQHMREEKQPQIFIAARQNDFITEMSGYVRTRQDAEGVFAAIRRTVAEADPNVPVYEMRTLREQLDQNLSTERMIAFLAAAFGLLATALAAIGLYGVLAYSVARRTREIGIRMALGASGQNVVWLVLRELLLLVGLGLTLAVPASLALTKLVRSQLFGISPNDPVSIGLAVLALALAGAIAGWVPARRAAQTDPMVALRYE
ncbi:MAG: ABC transporter permease [Bryobacteraceae bacterium]|nr:ABC transporter permease [Bryobacteraceae bacterium]